jgi:uncharacterized protein YkwD
MPLSVPPPGFAAVRYRRLAALAIAGLALLVPASRSSDAAAATCAHANAKPATVGRAVVERATRCELNAVRRRHGLRRLKGNRLLARAARRHSRDMVQRKYFAHDEPSGPGLEQRVRRAGYLSRSPRWKLGETLAWGSGALASVHEIVLAWMNSPPHRHVILYPSYREVGIGVAMGAPREASSPAATYTADFAAKG